MARKATKAQNIEERPTHYRVRISRKDVNGNVQKLRETFYWGEGKTKLQALAKAEAFARSEVASLLVDGKIRRDVETNYTLRDLIIRYQEEGLPLLKNGGWSTSSHLNVILSTVEKDGKVVEYFGALLSKKAEKCIVAPICPPYC
ncbi:hypothetical protein ISP15_12810 [Dyella jejuensis]|uniref:Uncharacterized protein n=1 Tax=Dyella jejuensis TaxID=1432009 RepID=A0ABW8JLZ2_9GAMM